MVVGPISLVILREDIIYYQQMVIRLLGMGEFITPKTCYLTYQHNIIIQHYYVEREQGGTQTLKLGRPKLEVQKKNIHTLQVSLDSRFTTYHSLTTNKLLVFIFTNHIYMNKYGQNKIFKLKNSKKKNV